MKTKLYSTPEAAEFLLVQPCTLEAWRCRGGGPFYLKIGRGVRYTEADLLEFLEKSRTNSTSARNAA